MPSNLVAIVGRPNVGKSTLFNRILGMREAIVHDMPGVTRDRKYADAEWAGRTFTIIDTGGFVPDSQDVFEKAIREQAEIAIEEADSILFVVDGMQGVLPIDRLIADILRRSSKPVHLVANKIDSEKREPLAAEFYSLGFGEPFGISALGGRQIGDFLDEVVQRLPVRSDDDKSGMGPRIAVVGKPNVGKSSLVNALLGSTRQVVTDVPGTTRDPIDSILTYHGKKLLLVDTAGLKKRKRTAETLDFLSALRTLKSLDRADVALIVLDAERGVDHQDLHIVETAMERKLGALIVVNKWDLIEKDEKTALRLEEAIRAKLGMYDFLPVLFVSALTKQRVTKAIDRAIEVHEERARKVSTSKLNNTLLPEIKKKPPLSSSPKEIRIKYITQIKSAPPVLAFFANEPNLVPESYKRYLAKRIRHHFGFHGVPLTLVFKKK